MLTLRSQFDPRIPVEVEGLTPTWAGGKTSDDIARFPAFHGNRRVPLAELFEIRGDCGDGVIEIEGDTAGLHWIGAGMSEGVIRVGGSAGRHLGARMTGGELHVAGDAGDEAGTAMSGGTIRVAGSVGELAGAAEPGMSRGMTGGLILVGGNAGQLAGRSMRRGLIAIGGAAGEFAGAYMLAGTVLVFGACGARPGAGMRRGTIALLGPEPPPLLPTFGYDCRYRPAFLRLVLRHLQELGQHVPQDLFEADFDLYRGDGLSLGRGEIVLRAP